MSENIKKFMYLNRRAPYGTIYAWESLEVVLIGAAFDQDVSLAFLDDGVNNGTNLTTPPQDDRNIVNRWSELAKEHDLDLVVCVAAAQRRGIVDEGEMQRNGKDAQNIADGFRISGLGQLIEAGIQSDRLVVFGD